MDILSYILGRRKGGSGEDITLTGNLVAFDDGDGNVTISMDDSLTPGTYFGIPVLIDNARLPKRNGAVSDIVSDPDWLIAGWFDTGDTTKKSYEFHVASNQNADASMRPFDDKEADSVDWWAASWNKAADVSTVQSVGRYVLFSVYKPEAYKTFLKVNDAYIFKGSGVV
jgi:hypothetical protein